MLYREIIAVCSQIHTKHINTLYGQNVELLNVKLAVHIVTTGHYPVNSGVPTSTQHSQFAPAHTIHNSNNKAAHRTPLPPVTHRHLFTSAPSVRPNETNKSQLAVLVASRLGTYIVQLSATSTVSIQGWFYGRGTQTTPPFHKHSK